MSKFVISATGVSQAIKPGVGNFMLSVTGGTTIAATLQKDYGGTIRDIPDPDGYEVIDAAWEHQIISGQDDVYYINTTAVSGSWDVVITAL
jgi:hypothetical protein